MSATGVIINAPSCVVIDLAETQSAHLLERSVQDRAGVVLRTKAQTEHGALAVRLAESRSDSLIVIGDAFAGCENLQGVDHDATLSLEGQTYLFGTKVLEVEQREGALSLEISRPLILQTWQRRRFVRAVMADSATVFIGAPDEFGFSRCQGMVLNVSRDGLACRMDDGAADRCRIGERVSVSFMLQPRSNPIKMNAAIKSKTPGGTKGTIILGMQFETADYTGQQDKLTEMLESNLLGLRR